MYRIDQPIHRNGDLIIRLPQEQVVVTADVTATGRIEIVAREVLLSAALTSYQTVDIDVQAFNMQDGATISILRAHGLAQA